MRMHRKYRYCLLYTSSGWTVYDTTGIGESKNAAVVLDGANASFTMEGGEITGNYNVGANAVAGGGRPSS